MGIQQNINQALSTVGNAVVTAKVACAADQARKEADFKRTVEEGEGIEKSILEATKKEMGLDVTNAKLGKAEAEHGKLKTDITKAQKDYEEAEKDPDNWFPGAAAIGEEIDNLKFKAETALKNVESIKRMKAEQIADLDKRREFIKARVEAYNKKVAKKYPGLPQYDVKGGKK